MIDYELFKEVVKEKFLSYMPAGYQGMDVEIRQVDKVNRRMDGLTLHGPGRAVSPTMYVNEMYRDFLDTGDLQGTVRNAAEAMDRAFRRAELPSLDTGKAKDNIVFQLVNTMQNEEMLKTVPHREYQDLSIIYRWVVGMDGNGISNVMVSNGLAEQLGMREEQLFLAAAENTRRILPPVVKSMNEVMRDIFVRDGMSQEMADVIVGEMPQEATMWVITNERGVDGAASMLYEDRLHDLAARLGTDLYLLPSSIHEVIAVPTGMGEPEELAEMVAEINMGQVELGARLSNQVYHYDKDLRKVTIATDTPNKRLDGVMIGQMPVHEAKQSR